MGIRLQLFPHPNAALRIVSHAHGSGIPVEEVSGGIEEAEPKRAAADFNRQKIRA